MVVRGGAGDAAGLRMSGAKSEERSLYASRLAAQRSSEAGRGRQAGRQAGRQGGLP